MVKLSMWTTDDTTSIPIKKFGDKKVSAVGTSIFDIAADIKVPKLSLLGNITAAGDRMPEYVLVPEPK